MSVHTQFVKKYSAPTPMTNTVAEEKRKISNLESFDELAKYACPKATQHKKDWYMTCVSCESNTKCVPGKRALEILEQETKPDEKVSQIEKFNNRLSAGKGINAKYALCGKEAYIETLKQPDPIAFIMKMNGSTKQSAKNRLFRWAKRYPDVPVNKTDEEKQITVIRKELKEIIDTPCAKGKNRELILNSRAHLIYMMTYPGGPFAYYAEVKDEPRKWYVRKEIKKYIDRYPDLDKRYSISKWFEENRTNAGRKKKMEETPMEPAKELQEEMSVDDFLNEMNVTPAKPKKDAEPVTPLFKFETKGSEPEPEESPIISTKGFKLFSKEEPKPAIEHKTDQQIVCTAMSDKRKELLKKIDDLQKKIAEETKELEDIRADIESLDKAATIMGLRVKGANA